ncbi:MAG: hypothetical protein WAQ05_16780 [Rubrivivax sp.]
MNPRVAITRLDIGLTGLDPEAAQALQDALPGTLQRTLERRLATAGAKAVSLQLANADLGTLTLPPRSSPQAAAEAIAAQLADWLDVRLAVPAAAAATQTEQEEP